MNRRTWTADERRTLAREYPRTPTAEIARRLNRAIYCVYNMAFKLCLKKSADYLASPKACRLRRGDNVGAVHRFQKGHTPANKGMRRPGWHAGRMRETQFKKGEKPHSWKPVGSTRVVDGYLQRKVTDTGYPPRDWKPVHVLLWAEHYGPVPAGYTVIFINGNKQDIRLDNLAILSRAELMRRNSYHNNYPKEIGLAIQLRGALIRKINRRARDEEHQRSA